MSQPPSVPLVRLFQSALAKCRQSSFLKAVHRKTHGWCLGRGKVPCSCQRHCSRSRCGWNFFWRAKCCSSCQGTWFDGSRLWHWKQPWGWYLHRLWNGKGSNFSGQAKKKMGFVIWPRSVGHIVVCAAKTVAAPNYALKATIQTSQSLGIWWRSELLSFLNLHFNVGLTLPWRTLMETFSGASPWSRLCFIDLTPSVWRWQGADFAARALVTKKCIALKAQVHGWRRLKGYASAVGPMLLWPQQEFFQMARNNLVVKQRIWRLQHHIHQASERCL